MWNVDEVAIKFFPISLANSMEYNWSFFLQELKRILGMILEALLAEFSIDSPKKSFRISNQIIDYNRGDLFKNIFDLDS